MTRSRGFDPVRVLWMASALSLVCALVAADKAFGS